LKKRVKRTSDARRSAEVLALRAVEHDRAGGPGAPSRLAVTRCMKRTGSASPVTVARSRSMTALRVVPGSALTERTSAMPSPATISASVIEPGENEARSMPSHSASVALMIGDAAFGIGGEEAGRRMVEMVDRLLQVEEEAFLLGPLARNVGELPGEQRLPVTGDGEGAAENAIPSRAGVRARPDRLGQRNSPSPSWPSRKPRPATATIVAAASGRRTAGSRPS
jgi:hypothetical protein